VRREEKIQRGLKAGAPNTIPEPRTRGVSGTCCTKAAPEMRGIKKGDRCRQTIAALPKSKKEGNPGTATKNDGLQNLYLRVCLKKTLRPSNARKKLSYGQPEVGEKNLRARSSVTQAKKRALPWRKKKGGLSNRATVREAAFLVQRKRPVLKKTGSSVPRGGGGCGEGGVEASRPVM